MENANLHNSLLGAILGQHITASQFLSDSLNLVAQYNPLAEWVQRLNVKSCLDSVSDGKAE
eukprot:501250-Rhodomonas_salina.1